MPVICDIFQAIITENISELKRLLTTATGTDLGIPFRGTTALSLAVYRNHLPSLCLLLDSGAPLDRRSMDHLHRIETPIISAIRLGHKNIFSKLLQRGAKLDRPDFYNQTPLWYAVKEQRVIFVNLLLEMGAPITFSEAYECPLNLVVQYLSYKARREMAVELVSAGLNVDLKDYLERSPLYWAVFHEDFPIFRLLIEAGSPVNLSNKNVKLNLPNIWLEKLEISCWLGNEISNPPSLVRQCRICIRHHLKMIHNRDLRPLISKLPLPQGLIDYILLKTVISMAMKIENTDNRNLT